MQRQGRILAGVNGLNIEEGPFGRGLSVEEDFAQAPHMEMLSLNRITYIDTLYNQFHSSESVYR